MTDAESRDLAPQAQVADLLALLDVEEIDTDLYRGRRQPGGRGRVFGGEVIAQALRSAMRSVEGDRAAHSLHAYFMRPGDETLPTVYRVERDFEGRSFSTLRVIALQRGQPILNLAASFHRPEPGLSHQAPMPEAPDPETLASQAELLDQVAGDDPHIRAQAAFMRRRPLDVRPVRPETLLRPEPTEARTLNWFRVTAPVGDDADVHRAILAYASDMALLGTSMLPHGVSWSTPGMQTASLDHALWLHEAPRVDDWLLYATESPWAGHGRGYSRGQIFTRDGRLVASVAQEGLIRRREG